MRAFAVCVLFACSPPPARPKPPERDAPDTAKPLAPRPTRQFPAPPTGFATADLVAMVGGEITAYALVDGALKATGSATIVKVDPGDEAEALVTGIGQGEWADRDHLFVTIGAREVVMITATAITEVPMPAPDTFKAPKPPAGPDGEFDAGDWTGGGGIPFTGLIVTAGEAWWAACPWGHAVDGFQCHRYINARLWPSALIKVDAPPLTPLAYSWPQAIAGHTIKTVDPRTITCEAGGKKVTISADLDATEEIDSVQWVSTTPPRLLVRYGHAGMASIIPDRFTLHAGCTQASLLGGSHVEPGPAGMWIATVGEPPHQLVYRHHERAGDFANHARLWPRPAK